MSYTTSIRNALSELLEEIPADLMQALDQVDLIVDSARDVVLSADNAGCDGELTVCDGEHVTSLKTHVNQLLELEMALAVQPPKGA